MIEFDFSSIPFYENHPYMIPHVGVNYESLKHSKLLLIGESHYLPEESTVNKDVDAWYGNPVLTKKEQEWCCPQMTISNDASFSKNIRTSLSSVLPSVTDPRKTLEEIAFYNFFLRPASTNVKTFKDVATKKDCEEAAKNLNTILQVLKPDLVVFASKDAVFQAEKYFKQFNGKNLWDVCEYVYTNHPSTAWWNSRFDHYENHPKYGEKNVTSKQFFENILKKHWLK